MRLTSIAETQFLTIPNDSFVGRSLETYGEWSHGEILLLSRLLRPDSNVVEVGANIGAHTVFIARDLCPSGAVYAFEPRRLFFQVMCANLALNGITNVFGFQRAAGKEAASLREGSVPPGARGNFGGIPIGGLKGGGEVIVVEPLDAMIDQLKPIALIKADVEGWERDVLLGARGLITRDRPILYVENDRVENSRDLITCIADMDYALWWHIVPLFRPDNRAGQTRNVFGNIKSFNMLCLPGERRVNVVGATRIEDPDFHPLAKSRAADRSPGTS